ncbi:LOW QUALITY PROTEIN: hypothetical protein Cgig2_013800 [Carnegiea gigantea]|uniref:Uncharacterized protein n=1 Tax=Carnegiea gigantea TaxID=171969 RepID=A0A9Q1QC49_9CARY|nr:LOW QUALITY PROTEIN: hypothetical protein Cgig2_013800 [Carnegiea gigantea]
MAEDMSRKHEPISKIEYELTPRYTPLYQQNLNQCLHGEPSALGGEDVRKTVKAEQALQKAHNNVAPSQSITTPYVSNSKGAECTRKQVLTLSLLRAKKLKREISFIDQVYWKEPYGNSSAPQHSSTLRLSRAKRGTKANVSSKHYNSSSLVDATDIYAGTTENSATGETSLMLIYYSYRPQIYMLGRLKTVPQEKLPSCLSTTLKS